MREREDKRERGQERERVTNVVMSEGMRDSTGFPLTAVEHSMVVSLAAFFCKSNR